MSKAREFWIERDTIGNDEVYVHNDPKSKSISGPREVIHVREVLPACPDRGDEYTADRNQRFHEKVCSNSLCKQLDHLAESKTHDRIQNLERAVEVLKQGIIDHHCNHDAPDMCLENALAETHKILGVKG